MIRLRTFFNHLPTAWRWCLPIWLAARIGLSLWGALLTSAGFFASPDKPELLFGLEPIIGGLPGALVGVWQRWDAIAYQRIATSGYHSGFDLSAYFPLFPLLGGGLHTLIGIGTLLALLVISSLAALWMLVLLYEIAALDFSESIARGAVVVAVIFPSAFFFFAPYPQSLTLLLTLLAYREARRSRWHWAALAGLAAGLAHSTVIPLAILLGMEALLRLKSVREIFSPRNMLSFLPAISPFVGMGLFLAWRAWQGFMPITQLMRYGWDRVIQWPWVTAAAVIECFVTGRINTNFVVDLMLLAFTLVITVWSWKKIAWPLWLYQLSLLIYLVSTSSWGQPLTGYSRYVLVMFPLFISTANLIRSKPARLILVAISLGMLLLLNGVYFMWGWIA